MVTSSADDAIVAGVCAGDEAVSAQLLNDWSRSMVHRGPTVDPSLFDDVDGPHSGGWRSFPREWRSAEGDVIGHTSEEVCDMLALSGANQRVLLHRARASVRTRLASYLEPETATHHTGSV